MGSIVEGVRRAIGEYRYWSKMRLFMRLSCELDIHVVISGGLCWCEDKDRMDREVIRALQGVDNGSWRSLID